MPIHAANCGVSGLLDRCSRIACNREKGQSHSKCSSTRESAATEIISRYDQLLLEVHKQLFDHHPSTRRITKGRGRMEMVRKSGKVVSTTKRQTVQRASFNAHCTLPLKLDTDASQYGIGAVISHVLPSEEERPIAYVSRTLSKSKRNYPQIEKEALSIIFGVKKFHQYLYGRKFLLVTDHKPLTTVLGPKSGIPTLAAARLQQWVLLLATYQYDIEYRLTEKHANADCLSLLPIQSERSNEGVDEAKLVNLLQIESLPMDIDQVRKETRNDPILSRVLQFVMTGWPEKQSTREVTQYFNKCHEITVEDGCLLWGIRVIIPKQLRERALHELHAGHPEIV